MSAVTTAKAPARTPRPAGPWNKLSKAMTAEVPAIAGRPVPVACTPRAGRGHPACYLPLIPVIEVSGKLLGVDPATANPASPADRQRYKVTWGALIHECAHAAHSLFCPPPAQAANWCEAARQLEESRAEHRQVTRRPGDRRWLRATVTRLILYDFTAAGADPSDLREAGAAAALLLAREDAGILEPAEAAPVTARVEAAIGADRLARLRATWREAHQAADGDARPGTARLLALVTDTNYSRAETLAAQNRITRLHRAGCGVIILRPKDTYYRSHEWTGCQVIEIDNPAGTVDAIARAATRALNA